LHIMQSRRDFFTTVSAAGAGVLGGRRVLADEAPPETTTIRIGKLGGICLAPQYLAHECLAPQYLAHELLRAEGFTDVRYIESEGGTVLLGKIASGEADFTMMYAANLVGAMDAGLPLTVVAGVHPGCFELLAHEPIQTVSDLKGKKVGTLGAGDLRHDLVAIMAAQVGLDPGQDIDWVTDPSVEPMQLFAEGRIDAFLGFPPEPQELRARKIGHVVVNSALDRPWSQYFCCLLAGRREFVRNHPIATKRVTRAVLKAADQCVAEPERMAQRLVEDGFTKSYDYAIQTLTEVPYGMWREYDPEDTLRFYALRLHEVGLLNNSPNQILAEGTDWRFLNELKRELKA
jgi:NitT/TauT family transport system substrate-binding protein